MSKLLLAALMALELGGTGCAIGAGDLYACNLEAACPRERTRAIGHVEAGSVDAIWAKQDQWLWAHCADDCDCTVECIE